jgi:chemotaxis protein methyltransferase CheR/type IV pilus assembly protein PilK
MVVAENPVLEPFWRGIDPLLEMDEQQFDLWVKLIRDKTGMRLPKERKTFLVTSLNLRMREIGHRDYQSYYDFLHSGREGNIEWTALVDRLTVHETRFYRDARAVMLFEENLAEYAREGATIQIWSAGCSTGEEPYTLAMVADRFFEREAVKGYYGITATDISLVSLASGKRAVYAERKLRDLDPSLKERYLKKLDNGQFQVAEKLRKRVCFAQLNILDARDAPIGMMDIIFCQNLLIYFDQEKRTEILDAMVCHLKPNGLLVLGPGEVIDWRNPDVARVKGTTVLAYRRRQEVS